MTLECAIEEYLDTQAKLRGGVTVKLNPIGNKGIPDRLVVLPGPRILFVETKRPAGGVIARLQEYWHSMLRRLGCEAHYARTKGEVDDLFTGRQAD